MNTHEKLIQMEESKKRNETMEAVFKRYNDRQVIEALEAGQAKAASVHRTIEIYAESILESLDILAAFHGETRSDLLSLLTNTAWALEQIKAQEG